MDVFTGVIAAALSAIVAGRAAPACDGALRRLVGVRG
jgi:hypothetical protein